MLFAILAVLAVCLLALVAIAALSTTLCSRLGLHPTSVLAWFGVVSAPGRR